MSINFWSQSSILHDPESFDFDAVADDSTFAPIVTEALTSDFQPSDGVRAVKVGPTFTAYERYRGYFAGLWERGVDVPLLLIDHESAWSLFQVPTADGARVAFMESVWDYLPAAIRNQYEPEDYELSSSDGRANRAIVEFQRWLSARNMEALYQNVVRPARDLWPDVKFGQYYQYETSFQPHRFIPGSVRHPTNRPWLSQPVCYVAQSPDVAWPFQLFPDYNIRWLTFLTAIRAMRSCRNAVPPHRIRPWISATGYDGDGQPLRQTKNRPIVGAVIDHGTALGITNWTVFDSVAAGGTSDDRAWITARIASAQASITPVYRRQADIPTPAISSITTGSVTTDYSEFDFSA